LVFELSLGSVGPLVLRASKAEDIWSSVPENATFARAAEFAGKHNAISDVRSGAEYRREMIRNLTFQGLQDVFPVSCPKVRTL